MDALLASTALGLVAAWPASGLGWLLGRAAEALTADPQARARAWNQALRLPPAALALMVGVAALPEEATAPVYQAAMASHTFASAASTLSAVSGRALSGFDAAETLGAALVVGALGGLVVAGVRDVLGRVRLGRIVKVARPVPQDLALAVRAAARRMDTGRPEVKISADLDQPLLAGLSTPVILLPSALVEPLDIDRLVPVCAHELAHLKRGDNWRMLFEHLLGGLFWMAPPYALLRARAAAAREEAADALALDGAALAVRKTYAETLITVLRARAAPTLHPAFTGKGRRLILMRLQAITEPRAPASRARRALIALIGLLAAGATATGSMALAEQADGGGASSRSVITDGKGLRLDIRSDYVRVTNAELVDGQLKPEDGQVWTYHGGVRVKGRLNSPQIRVLLDGQAPPPGFDPTALPAGAIQQLQVTHHQRDEAPTIELNVITKPGL
jgi:beta-lactamase regulating signal transducer with metallopeptidase domain